MAKLLHGWRSALQKSFGKVVNFAGLGPVLWDHLLQLPTSLEKLARALEKHETQPPSRDARQRDMLPLPFADIEYDKKPLPTRIEAALNMRHRSSWLRCMVTALNYEYSNKHGGTRGLPLDTVPLAMLSELRSACHVAPAFILY